MFDKPNAVPRLLAPALLLTLAACLEYPEAGLNLALRRSAADQAPSNALPTRTLEAHQLDRRYWDELLATIATRKLPIDSVLVAEGGAMVAQQYFGKYGPDTPHDLRSATKSITSLLVGITIDRGLVPSVHEPVAKYFPEYGAANPATLQDLLTMRTGLDCNDWQKSPGHEERMYDSRDWLSFFFRIPTKQPPGAAFSYCTAGTVVLGEIVARAAQRSLPQFAQEALFDPLRIAEARWKPAPRGVTDSGGHLELTPVSLLKIGMMVEAGGVWEGRRIVSEAWLRESVAVRPHSQVHPALPVGPHYGYLWWLEPVQDGAARSFQARGNGGQYIIVVPEHDLVAVYTGHAYNDDVMMEPFRLTSELLIPMARRTPFDR